MTIKIIACEVMKEELLAVETKNHIEFEFVSMGMHRYPRRLHKELANILERSGGYATVILAFGLCGGAAGQLTAPDCPLIMPRVHDCIPLLLGSRQTYAQLNSEEQGTFYLSRGWLATEQNILAEHRRTMEKYGEKKAFSILSRMYDSYKRVLFIHTDYGYPDAAPEEQSRRVAALLRLSHHTMQGDNSFLHKIVNGPWDEENFIHIAPLGVIDEENFGIFAQPQSQA